MNSLLLALLNGSDKGTAAYGNGAIVAVLCIVMVFLILALIIAITWVVNFVIKKFEKKTDVPTTQETVSAQPVASKPDLNDEDAMVATIVASIDLRNETNKNVKVISVKEIK